MLISVHVPKTAGSSFLSALEQVFGSRLLRVYVHVPPRYRLIRKAIRAAHRFRLYLRRTQVVRDYDAVHGHFPAHWFDFLPGAKRYCVFLRDPVDRVVSNYLYWQRLHKEIVAAGQVPPYDKTWRRMIEEELSVEEFAALPHLVSFYRMYMGRKDVAQFDFVGLQEEYGTSLALFEKIFDLKLAERRENVLDREESLDQVSRVDKERIRALYRENQAIYDAGRRRFDQLCEQYLR
ncbi:MAG TPA: hypothetical protein VN811_16225 [Thermoanaerobaculia bacterium]|nr:hypothetical protein [Thermoanaerobaculia bacterium]